MPLKNSFWSYLLLAAYVICFSAGLFSWGSSVAEFEHDYLQKALGQGWLIALVYLGLQTKFYLNTSWLHKIHFFAPVALYLEAYQSALPFLWFWSLLLLQIILIVTYEEWIVWRRIPVLKNLLIAAMWFIQLNVIPGLAGHASLIFIPFFIFYLALSIQVDIEDIAEDAGKIKTLASLLGKETAGYLVIFLLTLFAFLIGLPWVWIMLALIVLQREFNLPKGSYDALLFLLGLYFLLR
jgi:hypothetical protein